MKSVIRCYINSIAWCLKKDIHNINKVPLGTILQLVTPTSNTVKHQVYPKSTKIHAFEQIKVKVKVLLGYIPNYYCNAKSLACDTENEHALTCTRETYSCSQTAVQ